MKDKYLWAVIVLAACGSLFFSPDLWNAEKSILRDDRVSRIGAIPIPAGATGPENLAFDLDDEGPYTGVSDGQIMKWRGENLAGLSMLLFLIVRLSVANNQMVDSHYK